MDGSAGHLTRTLTLGPVVLFGLAYMAPMIVLGTFGVLDEDSGGVVPTAYLLALVAMLFTAMSYGRLAAAFPVAGSAYTYTRRTIDARVGFLVGWAVLLDYFFIPMVIWLIGAAYLNGEFPSVPAWVWILLFIVLTTALNVVGIKVAANVNLLLMAMQVLVLIFFVVLSFGHMSNAGGFDAIFSAHPFWHAGTTVSKVAAGAAVAAYSFLGFDAITTLTEETTDARRTIPRAILLVTVIGGIVFVIASYATQLVAAGVHVNSADTAASDIAKVIGGRLFGAIFLAGLVITQFASGIAAQASASRLLYAMGRDGVLPRRIFGFVHRNFHTPVFNIGLIGVVGIIAVGLNVSESTSFINFGAFTAFTFVNLCVIALSLRNHTLNTARGILTGLIAPLIGAGVDVWLLTNLDNTAIILGVSWLVLGILYLLYLTRGLRVSPPEMDLTEGEAAAST
ncbi:APC family permease [Nocardia alni]|uniref:APC family permease n=1 Tax=Nocardia alni TaxID=2815723 RepID=UPI001C2175CF|nr:APC family permease [Nocardia alni]